MNEACKLINLVEELLCESPHYDKEVTGVSTLMDISRHKASHGPRVKIEMVNKNGIPINIITLRVEGDHKEEEIDSQLLSDVREFILLNQDTLIKFYKDNTLDTDWLLDNLIPLGGTGKLNFQSVFVQSINLYAFVTQSAPNQSQQIKFNNINDIESTLTLDLNGKQLSNNSNLSPSEYNNAKKWLLKHKDLFLDYWNHIVTIEELKTNIIM